MRFVVVYDACVLYPAPLRDFLVRLATTNLFAARWTDQIHEEWIRNVLAKRSDVSRAHAQMIVTFNLRDFPAENLDAFGIEAIHPDRFIECQMDLREAAVVRTARAQRQSLKTRRILPRNCSTPWPPKDYRPVPTACENFRN
ncbi:MAG: hypothetical protein V2J42_13330 [Wenzhouxiangella sp.]|jgi:hypothetical protein|nr:hypothetical protein [Wenzhouxiangella sp.]